MIIIKIEFVIISSNPQYEVAKLDENLALQGLGEIVGNHLLCWAIYDFHISLLHSVTDIEVTYV